jgi:hypothetical protein
MCFVSISKQAAKIALNGWFLGAFAKLRKATISFEMSVYPHGTTRFPLDGFSLRFDI